MSNKDGRKIPTDLTDLDYTPDFNLAQSNYSEECPFDEDYYVGKKKKKKKKKDPLFFHRLVRFDEIEAETDKAILFDIQDVEVWVPKSLIKRLDTVNNTCYVWKEFDWNGLDIKIEGWND